MKFDGEYFFQTVNANVYNLDITSFEIMETERKKILILHE